MGKKIAVIGAGFAGLHLALLLQQHEVEVTLYTDRTSEQVWNGQLLNTVARFHHNIEREHALGIDYWDETARNIHASLMYIGGEHPLSFVARLSNPASFLDTRIYMAVLLDEFAQRGGEVVISKIVPEDVQALSEQYSLVVVAGGKNMPDMFPRAAEHSPYSQPQRILCAGYYRGIRPAEGYDFSFIVAPGHGEFFQARMHTFSGDVQGLLVEGIPGQGFSPLANIRYKDNPEVFNQTVLEILRQFAPTVYERIDVNEFGVTRPEDVLQGAITPTVRRAYTRLPNGKHIIAVGDAFVLNDPIVGQGANTSIVTAWILGAGDFGKFAVRRSLL